MNLPAQTTVRGLRRKSSGWCDLSMVSRPQSLESAGSSGSNSLRPKVAVCPGWGAPWARVDTSLLMGHFQHHSELGGPGPSWIRWVDTIPAVSCFIQGPVDLNVARIEIGHVLDEQTVFLQGLQLGGATFILGWTRVWERILL